MAREGQSVVDFTLLFGGGLEVKHKIWLELDGKVVFGQGRRMLLRAVDECRSLNSAAKKLNMSYRAAWGRLKATEKRLGMRLVEVDSAAGGMRLTDEAREFLDKFDELETQTESFVKNLYLGLAFPGETGNAPHRPAPDRGGDGRR